MSSSCRLNLKLLYFLHLANLSPEPRAPTNPEVETLGLSASEVTTVEPQAVKEIVHTRIKLVLPRTREALSHCSIVCCAILYSSLIAECNMAQ